MPNDLQPMMSKLMSSGGSKKFFFVYGAGKRKDRKGDGTLFVRDSTKPKKAEIEGELAECKEVLEGICWVGKGSEDDGTIYMQGKTKKLSAMLVSKMALTAKAITGRQYDFQMASPEEEARVANVAEGNVDAKGSPNSEAKPAASAVKSEAKPLASVKPEAKPASSVPVKETAPQATPANPKSAVEDAQARSRLWNELGGLQKTIAVAIQQHPDRNAELVKLYDGVRGQLRIGQGGTIEGAERLLGELTKTLTELDGAASKSEVKPAPASDDAEPKELQARLKPLLLRQKEAIARNPELKQKLLAVSQPASSLVATYKAGTSAKAAIEALDKLEAALNATSAVAQGAAKSEVKAESPDARDSKELHKRLKELLLRQRDLVAKNATLKAQSLPLSQAASNLVATYKPGTSAQAATEALDRLDDALKKMETGVKHVSEPVSQAEAKGETPAPQAQSKRETPTPQTGSSNPISAGDEAQQRSRLWNELSELRTRIEIEEVMNPQAESTKELTKFYDEVRNHLRGGQGSLEEATRLLSKLSSMLDQGSVPAKGETPAPQAEPKGETPAPRAEPKEEVPASQAGPKVETPAPQAKPKEEAAVSQASETKSADTADEEEKRKRLWNELGELRTRIEVEAVLDADSGHVKELTKVHDEIRSQLRTGQGGSLEEAERLLGKLTSMLG